jgi:hypothetical protein
MESSPVEDELFSLDETPTFPTRGISGGFIKPAVVNAMREQYVAVHAADSAVDRLLMLLRDLTNMSTTEVAALKLARK